MSISQILAKKFSNYDIPQSPASKLRAKRITPLLMMIKSIHKNNGSVSIVDLGGSKKYWNIVSSQFFIDYNVNITIVNLTARKPTPEDHGPFKFIEADACNLSQFNSNSFDIAHSNSVVEHVGDWGRMVSFAEEVKRVSKSYFVQTPNYWFPIEPHSMTPFFHWLPIPIKLWLVSHFTLGHWRKASSIDEALQIVDSARLLNKKMLLALFADATIVPERLFLLTKSFVAMRHEKASQHP